VTGIDTSAHRAVEVPRWYVPAMAGFMGMAAIAIDSLLPAFPRIREAFDLPSDSARPSLLLTLFLLGMAAGQLVFGPASDRFGRRPVMAAGLVLYIAAGIAVVLAPSLELMIALRFVWGFGAAAPRSLTVAMVRDTSEGDSMARAMSMIVAVFIAVPVVAPSLSAGLMAIAPWRIVFWVPIAMAVVLLFVLRAMPETLPPERRRAMGPRELARAGRTVVTTRSTVGFGLATVFFGGVMFAYLGAIEVILDEVYDLGSAFPFIFGGIAIFFSGFALLNGRLVSRFGVARVLRTGALLAVVASAALVVIVVGFDGRPPLLLLVVGLLTILPIAQGSNPNCNTLAMLPMAHIAGTASAVLGTASLAGSALLGALSNAAFDRTVTPFAVSVLVFSWAAAGCVLFIGRPGRP
jgi:DHA1 family bicyclomycin/chloramphenicol resistance-like MFS transporter